MKSISRYVNAYTFVLDLARAQSVSDIINNFEGYEHDFYSYVFYEGFFLLINHLINLVENLNSDNYNFSDIIQILLDKNTYLYGIKTIEM